MSHLCAQTHTTASNTRRRRPRCPSCGVVNRRVSTQQAVLAYLYTVGR